MKTVLSILLTFFIAFTANMESLKAGIDREPDRVTEDDLLIPMPESAAAMPKGMVSAKSFDVGTYLVDDCNHAAERYFPSTGQEVVCRDNFLYFTKKHNPSSNYRGPINIGSFNLYHMGDEQSFLKNYATIALIINRWDLAGAVEMMPPKADIINYNTNIASLTQNKQVTLPSHLKNEPIFYIIPGYIKILKELQSLDPSWSLIMGSRPTGEGSTGEMAGFYFRSSRVTLSPMNECGADAFGCPIPLSAKQQNLVSRPPFMAQFKINDTKLAALAVHARFRGLDPANADDEAKYQEQVSQLCAGSSDCPKKRDELSRYFEIFLTTNYMNELKKTESSRKVLFMGDFNLEWSEISPSKNAGWRLGTRNYPGLEVFQYNASTLSVKTKTLKSNYDHFLFNKKELGECKPESAHSIDLTLAATKDSDVNDPLFRPLSMALTYGGFQAYLENYFSFQQDTLKLQSRDANNVTFDLAKNIAGEASNLSALQDKIKKRTEKVFISGDTKNIDYMAALVELVSDHVPVEMSCDF